MVVGTQLIGVAITLMTAALFGYVGNLIRLRDVSEEARPAIFAFGVWWIGAASVLTLDGLHTVFALVGVRSLQAHLIITFLQPIALAIALWGLLYYLTYLLTGRRSAWLPLAALQLGVFVYTVFYYVSLAPWTLSTTIWETRFIGEGTPSAGISVVFGVLIATPVVLASLTYGRLFFKLREPELRYRIAIVSSAFALWFGTILFGFLMRWEAESWFPLLYRGPGMVAALLIFAAYQPPRWVRKRLTTVAA